MDQHLTGILPVLPTAYCHDGTVDKSATKALVSFAIECGVSGLVFPGFASEVSELAAEERKNLLSIVVSETNNRLPVIAGASADTADAVITHGNYASKLGLQHIMVQSPVSIGNDPTLVLGFFDSICNALPTMQIILQNAPAPRGADLTPQTILDVCRQLPQVAYIKEETLPAGPAISALLKNKPDSLQGVIGGGGARYILDEYTRGACAAMPALEIADLHVKLDSAWRSGNTSEARDLYIRTLPLLSLQSIYRMRLTKHVLMRRGVMECTHVRAPTPTLDQLAIKDIDNNLQELGLLELDSLNDTETL